MYVTCAYPAADLDLQPFARSNAQSKAGLLAAESEIHGAQTELRAQLEIAI